MKIIKKTYSIAKTTLKLLLDNTYYILGGGCFYLGVFNIDDFMTSIVLFFMGSMLVGMDSIFKSLEKTTNYKTLKLSKNELLVVTVPSSIPAAEIDAIKDRLSTHNNCYLKGKVIIKTNDIEFSKIKVKK